MFRARLSRFATDASGNIAIMAAISAPLILYSLGLGVDYGMMTLQQRRLQQLSDIGAIVAAADINHAADNLVANFDQNGLNIAVRTNTGYATKTGSLLKQRLISSNSTPSPNSLPAPISPMPRCRSAAVLPLKHPAL